LLQPAGTVPNITAIFFIGDPPAGHHDGKQRELGYSLQRVLFSEQASGKQMDTLTQLQQNRRIIHDLTVSTLARIDSSFSRLAYMASLRDISTNVYEHAGPQRRVSAACGGKQALEQCHQKFSSGFLRHLWWRRKKIARAPQHYAEWFAPGSLQQWRRLEGYRSLLTADSPEYLKELFLLECSRDSGDSGERAVTGTGSG